METNDVDLTALYREDATHDEYVAAMQQMINTGDCWLTAGSIGRSAMDLIEQGFCVLGEVGHNDYYGNYVPSRYEVEPGSKGSQLYANERQKLALE